VRGTDFMDLLTGSNTREAMHESALDVLSRAALMLECSSTAAAAAAADVTAAADPCSDQQQTGNLPDTIYYHATSWTRRPLRVSTVRSLARYPCC